MKDWLLLIPLALALEFLLGALALVLLALLFPSSIGFVIAQGIALRVQ